ncbi:MAG: molybdenum cofactor guanylyltransferase [Thermoplasmata archaeon]
MKKISIAILCGGNSSRFRSALSGQGKSKREEKGDKLFYSIAGSPFYKVNYKKFDHSSADVFLQGMKVDSLRSYDDMVKNKGPLGGIYSALQNAKYEHVFIVGADMPLVESTLLKEFNRYLDHPLVVPRWDSGYIEPLCSIYSKSILPTIKEMLERDVLKVSELCERIENVLYLSIETLIETKKITANCFTNINTKEDLKKMESKYIDRDRDKNKDK